MVQGSTGTGYGGFIYLYHPKEWQQAYYKATKPKRQAYGKKYYELNKEKLLKKSKEYYNKPDENGNNYYQRNREKLLEYGKRYRDSKKVKDSKV